MNIYITGGIVFSVACGGGLLVWLFKRVFDRITDTLSKKNELRLNKELEDFKGNINKELEDFKGSLERKNYVSKVRFDAEFEIFRRLSETFSHMVKDVYLITPLLESSVIIDREIRENQEKERYEEAENSLILAENELRKNAPFIKELYYGSFNELRKLCSEQINSYRLLKWNIEVLDSIETQQKIHIEMIRRASSIQKEYNQLTKDVRGYLELLDVNEKAVD